MTEPLSTVLCRLALADLCEASHALQAGAVADWCATLCRAHRRLDAYASALRSEGRPVPAPSLIVTEAVSLTPDERAYFRRYGMGC